MQSLQFVRKMAGVGKLYMSLSDIPAFGLQYSGDNKCPWASFFLTPMCWYIDVSEMAYEPLVPHKYTVNMLYLVCVMFGGIWFCILFKSFYLNLDWFSHFKAMYLIWRRESTAKGTRTNTLPIVIHLQYSALMCEYVNNGLVYLRNMIFFFRFIHQYLSPNQPEVSLQ